MHYIALHVLGRMFSIAPGSKELVSPKYNHSGYILIELAVGFSLKQRMWFLLLAFLLFAGKSTADHEVYDWGEDIKACIKRKPVDHKNMTKIEDKDYYKLVSNSDTFYPGQVLHFHIEGKEQTQTYKGVLLTVMQITAEGTWHEFHKSKYKRLPCWQKENTAIVEANKRAKFVEDDVFVWTAPDDCNLEKPLYELLGTVIKSDTEYLPGLSLKLKCVEKGPKPEIPIDACKANYTATLPEGTSFEKNFDGWWNSPKAALRWTRHMGETESEKTGPSEALHGVYYLYAEASFPAKEGDMAILNSPPFLKGCLCVRFKCHMWGGNGTYFAVSVDGKEQWRHAESGNVWLDGYMSINNARDPLGQLVMHRGVDFRGDIAIDDFSYHQGMCAEDLAKLYQNN